MAQVSQLQSALVPAASSNSASSAVASVGEQGVMFLATKMYVHDPSFSRILLY